MQNTRCARMEGLGGRKPRGSDGFVHGPDRAGSGATSGRHPGHHGRAGPGPSSADGPGFGRRGDGRRAGLPDGRPHGSEVLREDPLSPAGRKRAGIRVLWTELDHHPGGPGPTRRDARLRRAGLPGQPGQPSVAGPALGAVRAPALPRGTGRSALPGLLAGLRSLHPETPRAAARLCGPGRHLHGECPALRPGAGGHPPAPGGRSPGSGTGEPAPVDEHLRLHRRARPEELAGHLEGRRLRLAAHGHL